MEKQTPWSVTRCGATAVLVLGCGASAEPEEERATTVEALQAECPPAQIVEPGLFSLPETEEYRIAFTPDGETAFFTRSQAPFFEGRAATIYVSQHRNGSWSLPEVAPFSGQYPDLDPFISADGEHLFFSSIRPVAGEPRTDADIWRVDRAGEGWGEPVNLGPTVNALGDELYPTVTANGDVYFGSDRPGGFGAWDIWRTSLGETQPENLGPAINTEGLEFNPWVSPGGHAILFAALERPDGLGSIDLYGSLDLGLGFASAMNLGPCVNTAADEYHPSPVLESGELFFVRHPIDPWFPGELYKLGHLPSLQIR